MKKLLKYIFKDATFDQYIEGVYAHQYKDENIRKEISETYNLKYKPTPTPYTHPERFDPLDPPKGWAYDPFYEIWIQL